MTPPSLLSFRVKQPLSTMPHTRASYQKERRDKIKREKMERKRMYREKVAEGRKKIKETAEVAEPMVVDDNEEENEIVMDEPKWNVGDHVVLEDSRVGASRKLFGKC